SIIDSTNANGGCLFVTGGAVSVRNSFIGGNSVPGAGIWLLQGSVDVLYSTIATGSDGPAINCQGGMGSGSTVRNSILVSRAQESEIQGCTDITIENSALEMAVDQNVALGDMIDTSWFAGFLTGDFHLSNMHPLAI